MRIQPRFTGALGALLMLAGSAGPADSQAGGGQLLLQTSGSEFLSLEPIIVTLRTNSKTLARLPAVIEQGKTDGLRFEIEPPVKARAGAKPLPLEAAAVNLDVRARDYDLAEWFVLPEGSFHVRAVLESKGTLLHSDTVRFTIRRPGKGDAEQPAVGRIHHLPWSNYEKDAFCGDTFDLVKQWPDSRLASYCHYWNGRYLQNKNEHDKAIASYRIVLEKYRNFALADDAEFGIVECLVALKNLPAAQKENAALQAKLQKNAAGSSIERLAQDMARRISAELKN